MIFLLLYFLNFTKVIHICYLFFIIIVPLAHESVRQRNYNLNLFVVELFITITPLDIERFVVIANYHTKGFVRERGL